MMLDTDCDAIVIGGGFYGCSLALYLQRSLELKVIIVEMAQDLLQRASYVNQARVHHGYHYPRSFLTGLRSRVNFLPFIKKFQSCVDTSFDSYYAIGRISSKVNALQFKLYCKRIGAPIQPAPLHIRNLFDPDFIEDVFLVRECVFDAVKLRSKISRELTEGGVEVRVNAEASKVRVAKDSSLEVIYTSSDQAFCITARSVFNCTYSRINKLVVASGLTPIPLKHELAEIALVEVPEHLKNLGITIMCGPFFSVLPFPPRRLHALSHVRYTPHCEWNDTDAGTYRDPYELFDALQKKTNYPQMIKDAQRYLPSLRDCQHVDSIWEVKTVLPRNEVNDGRPILLKRDYGFRNFSCILGSKVDNVYDLLESLHVADAS